MRAEWVQGMIRPDKTTNILATISSCKRELWPLTLTCKLGLTWIVSRWSSMPNIFVIGHFVQPWISRHTDIQTHGTECSIWTTEVVGKYSRRIIWSTAYRLRAYCRTVQLRYSSRWGRRWIKHSRWFVKTKDKLRYKQINHTELWADSHQLKAEIHGPTLDGQHYRPSRSPRADTEYMAYKISS